MKYLGDWDSRIKVWAYHGQLREILTQNKKETVKGLRHTHWVPFPVLEELLNGLQKGHSKIAPRPVWPEVEMGWNRFCLPSGAPCSAPHTTPWCEVCEPCSTSKSTQSVSDSVREWAGKIWNNQGHQGFPSVKTNHYTGLLPEWVLVTLLSQNMSFFPHPLSLILHMKRNKYNDYKLTR